MEVVWRPFQGEIDKPRMSVLVHDFPAGNLHVADLPYRLSSWALDDPENVGIWVDAKPQLVAWAVLQTPFWAIDYAYRPDAPPSIHKSILAWADERARKALDTPSGRPMWFVNVFSTQQGRFADLADAGFACQARVDQDPWSKVWMARPAHAPLPDCSPPEEITIRPLAGMHEINASVELHRAAFESTSMTVEWRTRVLGRPEYVPQLDLVAANPHGELVAICICWFESEGSQGPAWGQIEPLGVHPAYRQRGVGKAILVEGIRRLHEIGAETVFVETDNYRNAALSLYESVGFRVNADVLVYRKDYGV